MSKKERPRPRRELLSLAERRIISRPVTAALEAARAAEEAVIVLRLGLIAAIPELMEALREDSHCEVGKVCWNPSGGGLTELWLELKLTDRTYFLYYSISDYPNLGVTKGLTVIPCPPDVVPDWETQALASFNDGGNWPELDRGSSDYRKVCGVALYDALPALSRHFPMAEKTIEELTLSLAVE